MESTRRKTNLFIVGAAKAGTTTLYELLGQHPDIGLLETKEPHHFSRVKCDEWGAAFIRVVESPGEYQELVDKAGSKKYIGEASTSYLWDNAAAERIYQYNPEARIIIILRDPVERAFSHYLDNIKSGYRSVPFEQLLESENRLPKEWGINTLYKDIGLYTARVEKYLQLFGKQVLILVYEDFFGNVDESMKSVYRFLGIDEAKVVPIEANAYGVPRNTVVRKLLGSTMARHLLRRLLPENLKKKIYSLLFVRAEKPMFDSETRAELTAYFRQDRESLENVLGRQLPWQ